MTDVIENTESAVDESVETPVNRVPEVLSSNPILQELCNRYLETVDTITDYNSEVLASKDASWTTGKVLEKARVLASPTEKGVKPVAAIKKAIDQWEKLLTDVALAKKNIVELTSKELGIDISVGAERNNETEAPLKEKRKVAVEIGTQLKMLANMISDPDAILTFLDSNPLPVVGRDQVKNFKDDATAVTPKYRVTVTVAKDDTTIGEFDGFTKAGIALSRPEFGYDRGKSLKADDLRNAWEKAGNSAAATTVDPVVFTDNGLTYTIKSK